LNQLWRRKGDNWSLALESSEDYELSEASVVGKIGELATGTLFSLGLRDRTIHSLQDVNRVISVKSLEAAAEHLTTETVDQSTARYDPERQQVVAQVHRKLGGILLSSFERPVEGGNDLIEEEIIREGHREHAWNNWEERKNIQPAYDINAVAEALQNPESTVYGTDPVTGDALLAWRGGNGQWCRTREIAMKSLEARQNRLTRAPHKAELRELKAAIKSASNELLALKRSGRAEAAELLSRKKKTDKAAWLQAAQELLTGVTKA
jgi:hypothetical protein